MLTDTALCSEIQTAQTWEIPASTPPTKHFVIRLRFGAIAWEGDAMTILDAIVEAFTRRRKLLPSEAWWDPDDLDFTGCDLAGIPVVPSIDREILDAIERGGLLNMENWHGDDEFTSDTRPARCGTTHCRAGWATHTAGVAGFALEDELNVRLDPFTSSYELLAGTLIYTASRPGQPIPDFYAENHEAMEDLRKCAATETF